MFQNIRPTWRQSLAALLFFGVAANTDGSALFAADDPFDEKVFVKKDAERDRPSAKDDEEDDDKKSAKRKQDDDDDFRPRKPTKIRDDDDDDKKPVKRKEKDDDEKEESLDGLRAKLKQLEAENAKLRNALQEKEAAASFKKGVEAPSKEKLPPIKSTKPLDPPGKKGEEKQPDEQQQILAKLKMVHEQIAQHQKEGRKEEVEKLKHAAEELQHALNERQAKHGKVPQKEHPPIAERIEQLKHEIEENARAGRKEQVEALRQELEKTIDQAHQMQRKGFFKTDPKHGPEAPPELMGVIKELGGQVQQLRAEVEELRRIVRDRDDRKK